MFGNTESLCQQHCPPVRREAEELWGQGGRGPCPGAGAPTVPASPCISIWGKTDVPGSRPCSRLCKQGPCCTSAGGIYHPCPAAFVLVVYGLAARIVFSGLKYSALMRYLSAREDAGGSQRRLGSVLTSLSTAVLGGSCCPGKEEKGVRDAERSSSWGVGVHLGLQFSQRPVLQVT